MHESHASTDRALITTTLRLKYPFSRVVDQRGPPGACC